ncbi:MAG: hypothetical protein E6149_09360 [Peptoniphilus harei]|nr:hypothetical protein [Peptoniphilus harei]
MKNKVIDYVTPIEVCQIIRISINSTPQITRWIKDGRIQNVIQFGKSNAIPISWVKSECQARGINWNGVELKENEVGVSLKDYTPLNQIEKKYNVQNLAVRIKRGQIDLENVIQFGNNWGIESNKIEESIKKWRI